MNPTVVTHQKSHNFVFRGVASEIPSISTSSSMKKPPPVRSLTSVLRQTTAMILAGGQGERLSPLARDRAKPAVPFGGIYRMIDFTVTDNGNVVIPKDTIVTPS